MGGGFRLSCFGFGSQLSSSSPLAMLTLELGVSEIGVPYLGVLVIRILLFSLGYYIRVPDFRKLPIEPTQTEKTRA